MYIEMIFGDSSERPQLSYYLVGFISDFQLMCMRLTFPLQSILNSLLTLSGLSTVTQLHSHIHDCQYNALGNELEC